MQRSAIERAASACGDAIGDWRAEKRSARTMARAELSGSLPMPALRAARPTRVRLPARPAHAVGHRRHPYHPLRAPHERDRVRERRGRLRPQRPHAEVIVAVIAWAAKMDRLATAERIAVARERLEADGGWGRPRRMERRSQDGRRATPFATWLGSCAFRTLRWLAPSERWRVSAEDPLRDIRALPARLSAGRWRPSSSAARSGAADHNERRLAFVSRDAATTTSRCTSTDLS